jgi:type II secretory pathway pseudopilin PulG
MTSFNKSTIPPVLHSRAHPRIGFTLTEIAIVILIIGAIIAAIWIAAAQMHEKSLITQAQSEFGTITQNMTGMLQGGYGVSAAALPCGGPTPPGGCDITGAMINAGMIPQWMVANGVATNPWGGGGVFLRWMSDLPRTYRLSFYAVSMEGCLGLVALVANCTPGQSGCPVNISSDGFSPGVGYVAPVLSMSTTGAPLTIAQMQGICGRNFSPPPPPPVSPPLGPPVVHPNSIEFDFTQ